MQPPWQRRKVGEEQTEIKQFAVGAMGNQKAGREGREDDWWELKFKCGAQRGPYRKGDLSLNA